MFDTLKILGLCVFFSSYLSGEIALGQDVKGENLSTISPSSSLELPTPPQKEMTLPTIKQVGSAYVFTLDNGLEVVVLPNHRAPVVTQMIWYRAGSADELPGSTGIAHFLEHLMFKGTKAYPDGAFSKFVTEVGGVENAFTSYDFTAYYQSFSPLYLKDMMEREADRMTNLALTDTMIDLERQVIIEERRMRTDNNPAAILGEEARAMLYLNSPYRHPVIGWKHEMETLTKEDALAFYERFYAPNNAVLIIAGDTTAETVRQLAVSTYGKIKPASQSFKKIRPQEPVTRSFREILMRDPRVTQATYQQEWVVPSYHTAKSNEAEALDLLAEILGGGVRSRLYRKLVVDQGLASGVQAAYLGAAIDHGSFLVMATPHDNSKIEELGAAIHAEIMDIVKNGVTKKELEQAAQRFIRTMTFSLDSPTGLAQIYGVALTTGMQVEDIQNWPDKINSVTSATIQQVAQRYLSTDKGVVSRLLPEK